MSTEEKITHYQIALAQTLKIYALASINNDHLEKSKKIADGEFGDDEDIKNIFKRVSASYERSKKYLELLREKIVDIKILLKEEEEK